MERKLISCCIWNKGLETAEHLKRKTTARIPISFHGHVKLHKWWSQSSAAELEVSRWCHGDETHCSLECQCRSLRHPRIAADRHSCLRISFVVHHVLFWTYKIKIVPNQCLQHIFQSQTLAIFNSSLLRISLHCSSNNTSSAHHRNSQQYTKNIALKEFQNGRVAGKMSISDNCVFSPHIFR